jgi:4-amino-4-deoxy-L-arabinose transferase-like glycosyltransferase
VNSDTETRRHGDAETQSRIVWLVASIVLVLVGGGLSWFGAHDFAAARGLVDPLSKDGSMEKFTPALYLAVRLPMLVGGLALFLAGMGSLVFPRRGQARAGRLLEGLGGFFRRLGADARSFWRDLLSIPLTRLDWLILGLLTLAGILLRLLYLWRPMVHDESYTFMAFAIRPWLAVISDYSLPNNHIFHTVLVKVSTSLLGDQPWAVRFPAFLAGVFCIPAGYVLAKRLYSRWTAALAAGLIAALPVEVMYSTNARGYTLYTLFTLLLVLLAIYLKSHRNLVGWLLYLLIAALGFYTLPMMVYPLGGISAWLFLSVLAEGRSSPYRLMDILKYLTVTGLLVGVLTALLYLPVIVVGTGWKSLVGNSFVERLSFSNFAQTFVLRMNETGIEWMWKLPAWIGIVLLVGIVLSLVFHARISREKVSLFWVMLGWLVVILLVQRPNPLGRLWTFLIPLCAIWASAGLAELLSHLPIPSFPILRTSSAKRGSASRPALNAGMALALLGLAYLVGFAYHQAHIDYPAWQEAPGQAERIAQYLQPRIQPDDIIVISSSDGPPLWYYSRLYGIPLDTFTKPGEIGPQFRRAFVVVSKKEDQTLQTAIEQRPLALNRFNLASAVLVLDLDGLQLYELALY